LTHRLLFERFLSAERGSLPDIEGVRASQAVLC
jgi:hypothetical protein